ncbi:MAG: hypothetical protein AAFV07_09925 [Bacteroidota bacterium]
MESFLEKIDQYIHHQLPEDEAQALLKRLEEDDAAAQQAKAYLMARQSIQTSVRGQIHQQVQQAVEQSNVLKARTFPTWPLYALAAAAVITLLFMVIQPSPKPDVNADDFLATNLKANFEDTYRAPKGYKTDSLWAEVDGSIRNKAFAQSLIQLLLLEQHPDLRQPNKLAYVQGLVLMDLGRTDEATQRFEAVGAGSQYHPDALWLSALLMIKTEKYPKAARYLDELENLPQAAPYQERIEQARTLLVQL